MMVSTYASHVLDQFEPTLRRLLSRRLNQLGIAEGDISETVMVVIVQPDDTPASVGIELGFRVDANFVDQTPFGDPDFTPSWEWLDHHPGWLEMTFVLSDDGFGCILFIQDSDDMDPTLLSLCRTYAPQAS